VLRVLEGEPQWGRGGGRRGRGRGGAAGAGAGARGPPPPRGEVAVPAAGLLRALAGRGALDEAVVALLAVGHTSGHDLARGMLAALRALVVAPTVGAAS
jgi:hypothetical protein